MMVCYWDTSALLPSFVEEVGTTTVKAWFEMYSDAAHFTSWLTLFEFESVLKRKLNQRALTHEQYESIQSEWSAFNAGLNLVAIDSRTARQGLRFQRLYGLKPYDSIQLGCASLIQIEYPDLIFACLDSRLTDIASKEGLRAGN